MQKEVTFVLIFSPLQGITNMSNLDQFINKLWQEVHIATSHLTAEDKEDAITTLQSKLGSLPNDVYQIHSVLGGLSLLWTPARRRVTA